MVLVIALVTIAGAGETPRPEGEPKRETRLITNSNPADTSIPQLASNRSAGPEVPMARETNPATGPGAAAKVVAARPGRTVWMILAVLAVMLGSHWLKRLRSRSDAS